MIQPPTLVPLTPDETGTGSSGEAVTYRLQVTNISDSPQDLTGMEPSAYWGPFTALEQTDLDSGSALHGIVQPNSAVIDSGNLGEPPNVMGMAIKLDGPGACSLSFSGEYINGLPGD